MFAGGGESCRDPCPTPATWPLCFKGRAQCEKPLVGVPGSWLSGQLLEDILEIKKGFKKRPEVASVLHLTASPVFCVLLPA